MVTEIPFVPPHESIEEELAASVAAADTSTQELPQTYSQHLVVRSSAPGTVCPLAIYVDGTPFSKLDSILGIFAVNIVTCSCSRNAPEDGHLQVLVQRMVLNFLRRGVRQVELFGNDVLVGTVFSSISF